jgi:hypothetical protein
MPLSDHYPELKGWTPAQTPVEQKPQIPDLTTQVSGFLRTTLPLPLQYSPDTLKQYNRPGMSSFRIAPLPPGGNPSVNSASTSVVNTSIKQFVNIAAAGPNGAVQFNNSGALGGVNQFTWNNVTSTLSITGSLTLTTPLGVASGGTGSNLSATGGASQVLLQTTVGGAVTVRQLTFADIGGSLVNTPIWNTVTKITTYTAVAGDMVLADTTGGGFTVTFPSAAANKNLSVRVKKISSDLNNVTAASADLIDGQASQIFNSQYTDLEATSNGTTWEIA